MSKNIEVLEVLKNENLTADEITKKTKNKKIVVAVALEQLCAKKLVEKVVEIDSIVFKITQKGRKKISDD